MQQCCPTVVSIITSNPIFGDLQEFLSLEWQVCPQHEIITLLSSLIVSQSACSPYCSWQFVVQRVEFTVMPKVGVGAWNLTI